ncbi:MAG: branched-chain amino acid ABC transporter permease [Deferrisomatales bacterium]
MSPASLIRRPAGLLYLAAFTALAAVPFVTSRFYIYILSVMLVTGLFATSLNLVLGYGGLYQFHHAVFYGFGAYAFALAITKGGLPAWAAFLVAPLASAALSLVMGAICVRLSKLYFGMLQISLGSLVWALVFRWYDFTGGDNGIHGVPLPEPITSTKGSYYFTLLVVSACLVVMFRIVNSPFGQLFQAIRDNPVRSEGIGIDVRRHQLVGLVLAGLFAGVAGSLFVVVEGSVVPDLLFWNLSLEVVVMALLGGWFTFPGPMVGAAILLSLRTFAGMYTDYWTLILGVILMALIYFLPEGVCGWVASLAGRGRPHTPAAAAAEEA